MSSDKGDSGKVQERAQEDSAPVCPACGTEARRVNARFCSTCGRTLEEHYRPADALRASYHLHRQPSGRTRRTKRQPPASKKHLKSMMLPEINRNSASTTALAFMTYALVPFLGILFVPGAVLVGVAGLTASYLAPHKGGRRASLASIFFGFVILGVQVLLWWIIIKVPEWTNPSTGGY